MEALVGKKLWSPWWVELLVLEPWLDKCSGSLQQLWVELLIPRARLEQMLGALENLGRDKFVDVSDVQM